MSMKALVFYMNNLNIEELECIYIDNLSVLIDDQIVVILS